MHYITISVISGMLFALLDGLFNANPLARKLMECYKPIAKTSVNIFSGIFADIFYGFIMCAIFLLTYNSLPSENPVVKGLVYGIIVWFFRVFMTVISSYMTQKIPVKTLLYISITGLIEVLVIGIFYGLTIKPA